MRRLRCSSALTRLSHIKTYNWNISHTQHFTPLTRLTQLTQLPNFSQLRTLSTSAPQPPTLTVRSASELRPRIYPEYSPIHNSKLHTLLWTEEPLQNVYIIRKPHQQHVTAAMLQFIDYLTENHPHINVIVDEEIPSEITPLLPSLPRSITLYTGPRDCINRVTDLIVTLGGDGTILAAASLFAKETVPPILSFSLGTLGFLLPFDFRDHVAAFENVYTSRARVLNRMRLQCHIHPRGAAGGLKSENRGVGWEAGRKTQNEGIGTENKGNLGNSGSFGSSANSENSANSAQSAQISEFPTSSANSAFSEFPKSSANLTNSSDSTQISEFSAFSAFSEFPTNSENSENSTYSASSAYSASQPPSDSASAFPPSDFSISYFQQKTHSIQTSGSPHTFHAMNDVSLHRGALPHLTTLDIFVDNHFLTRTTADGIVISTPTGSTAYSLSAGGSIVHPLVSCILLTPICPRSLSFRPLVIPSRSHIDVRVAGSSRGRTVKMSIDGKAVTDLAAGDEIRVMNEAGGFYTQIAGAQLSQGTGAEIGIWCVAKSEYDWVGGINELLGFNSGFRGQNGHQSGRRKR